MTGKSKKKKIIIKTASVVDIGCSNCKKLNFSSIFNPFPKKPSLPSRNYRPCHSSSSASSSSPFYKTPATPTAAAVAVEKDSDDPYLDFRQSMLQMILENQIYSKEDLRQLLHCFLSLNAPYHHGIIVHAFSEIWDGVFSPARRGGASPLLRGYGPRVSRDHYYYY